MEQKIEETQGSIERIKITYAKHCLYTLRAYEQIEKENAFWRKSILAVIQQSSSMDRNFSNKILQLILKNAGIDRKKVLSEINLETFVRAVEAKDGSALELADADSTD